MVVHRRLKGENKERPQLIKAKSSNNERSEDSQSKPSFFEKYWFLKYVMLVILAPPFINHAALYKENKELQPPGLLYDVGWGQKLYLSCIGKGAPSVIFDAPTGLSSDVWTLIAPKIARITKVCVYDRAGLGFSDRPYVNRSQPQDTNGKGMRGIPSTTERMVEDFHRLITGSSEQPKPFILVGSELGAVNMRFYTQLFDSDVVGLVLINPLVEGIIDKKEETWLKHWQSRSVATLQMLQFSAAVGLSRIALIFGLMKTQIDNKHAKANILARQKHLMCKPGHLSSAVDEFYFANESLSQMRVLRQIKPFPSTVGVSVVSSSLYSRKSGSDVLNKGWAASQDHIAKVVYPGSERTLLAGDADSALFNHAKTIATITERHVKKWRTTKQQAVRQ